jgi:hypothetical protein
MTRTSWTTASVLTVSAAGLTERWAGRESAALISEVHRNGFQEIFTFGNPQNEQIPNKFFLNLRFCTIRKIAVLKLYYKIDNSSAKHVTACSRKTVEFRPEPP